jgi:hypothetical protein
LTTVNSLRKEVAISLSGRKAEPDAGSAKARDV